MELDIKRFDPISLVQRRMRGSSPVIACIGKRGSGKSEVIRTLLYHNRDIPSGVVFSGTEMGNSFYKSFVPGLFIYNRFDSAVLRKIINRQKTKIMESGGKRLPQHDFFVILDDIMYDCRTVSKDLGIREIFTNGRHLGIFLIIAVQYVMDLSISLRSNIDLVFCMKENNMLNLEKIYKGFFGVFETKNLFVQVFNRLTENYGAIVADNTSRSNNINENIYWFRSQYPPIVFHMGSDRLWKVNDKYYDEKKELEIDVNDDNGPIIKMKR